MIASTHRYQLQSMFIDQNFLSNLHVWHLEKIRTFIKNDDLFFAELDKLSDAIPFNAFHYNLLSFYKNSRKNFNTTKLEQRIHNLRLK